MEPLRILLLGIDWDYSVVSPHVIQNHASASPVGTSVCLFVGFDIASLKNTRVVPIPRISFLTGGPR
jgi:hypothetical protein